MGAKKWLNRQGIAYNLNQKLNLVGEKKIFPKNFGLYMAKKCKNRYI